LEPHIAPTVAWCTDVAAAPALAQFFVDNVDTNYISHSELQGPRALDRDHWAPDLLNVLRREITRRIGEHGGKIPANRPSYPVFAVRRDSVLLGLGMISMIPTAPVPYAVIEDVVVARAGRDAGVGRHILEWLTSEARAVGCVRLFLESGVGNKRAHEFFAREGFTPCSVVMLRSVPPEA
jgi:GNAT superfamily N-acetyltransferase